MSPSAFTPEFKQECVELVIRQSYQVKQAAIGMNIGFSILQRWLSQYRDEQQGVTPNASAFTPEQPRIQ